MLSLAVNLNESEGALDNKQGLLIKTFINVSFVPSPLTLLACLSRR